MSESTTPVTPGTTDQSAATIKAAVAEAVAAALGPVMSGLKAQGDLLAKLAAPAAETPAAKTADAPLTAEAVAKIVAQQVKEQVAQSQTAAKLTADKAAFQASKLADLPATYRGLLGDDPTKWDAEEQVIRDRFRAEVPTAAKAVTGTPATGATPTAQPDLSKMSPAEKIALGLKSNPPPQMVVAPASVTPTADAAAK